MQLNKWFLKPIAKFLRLPFVAVIFHSRILQFITLRGKNSRTSRPSLPLKNSCTYYLIATTVNPQQKFLTLLTAGGVNQKFFLRKMHSTISKFGGCLFILLISICIWLHDTMLYICIPPREIQKRITPLSSTQYKDDFFTKKYFEVEVLVGIIQIFFFQDAQIWQLVRENFRQASNIRLISLPTSGSVSG